jgi:hypothetical protein
MMKNVVQIKGLSNNRESFWYLDNDCPLVDAKEMLFQFQKFIGQIEDNVRAQQEAKKAEEEAKAAAEAPKEAPPAQPEG